MNLRDRVAEALNNDYAATDEALSAVAFALLASVEDTTDARKRTIVTGLAHKVRNGDLPSEAVARYRLYISSKATGESHTETFQFWSTLESRVDELLRDGGYTYTCFSAFDGERVDL